MNEAQVRAQLINLIESHAGTLNSMPWDKVSLVDLHKLVTTVHIDCEAHHDLLIQASEIIVANNYNV